MHFLYKIFENENWIPLELKKIKKGRKFINFVLGNTIYSGRPCTILGALFSFLVNFIAFVKSPFHFSFLQDFYIYTKILLGIIQCFSQNKLIVKGVCGLLVFFMVFVIAFTCRMEYRPLR